MWGVLGTWSIFRKLWEGHICNRAKPCSLASLGESEQVIFTVFPCPMAAKKRCYSSPKRTFGLLKAMYIIWIDKCIIYIYIYIYMYIKLVLLFRCCCKTYQPRLPSENMSCRNSIWTSANNHCESGEGWPTKKGLNWSYLSYMRPMSGLCKKLFFPKNGLIWYSHVGITIRHHPPTHHR